MGVRTIKKYSNRRLYDTKESQYITLDQLAEFIRKGDSVRVVDAKSSEDLTQQTLAQIVVESRGAARLLPVDLLEQMIRMEDDALAEFMTMYMTLAFEIYDNAKRSMRGVAALNPFGMLPADVMSNWMNRLGRGSIDRLRGRNKSDEGEEDMTQLRQEIEELKSLVRNLADKDE